MKLQWEEAATLEETEKHHFVLAANSGSTISFSCLFAPEVGRPDERFWFPNPSEGGE